MNKNIRKNIRKNKKVDNCPIISKGKSTGIIPIQVKARNRKRIEASRKIVG